MKNKINLLTMLLFTSIFSQAQNGKIISREPFNIFEYDLLISKIAVKKNNNWVFKKEYEYLNKVTLEKIFYESDGLKVRAYLATNNNVTNKDNPAIIYNRGGNREFGALNEHIMIFIIAKVASWGYNVVASQYRGTDGGEGIEEFGGADVNDVLNLIPLIEHLPNTDASKIGMYGWSRGGMMTYLSLMKTDKIKAAVVGGAISNLKIMDGMREDMSKRVYRELMPNYDKNKKTLLHERSAVFNADKLCKTTPILLLHGTSDWRVIPEDSLNMALAMQKERVPYSLIMFEGGDHHLNKFNDEVNKQAKSWFDKYLKKSTPLPNLNPHGK